MTMALCVLASGSSGNCAALRLATSRGERLVLIDCGLSPRRTARRLEALGLDVDAVDAVIMTHLDSDHVHAGWTAAWRKRTRPGPRVHVHLRHRARALRAGLDGRHVSVFDERFAIGDDTIVHPIALAHDALGTVGFVIEHGHARLGWATDLGRVPAGLPRRFVDLDALAIESNYDPALQHASDRPEFLKRRIMGGRGHLSNEQSLDAVSTVARCSALQHVVALHVSRECNRPRLIRDLYRERLPHLAERLVIAEQHRSSSVLHVRPGPRVPTAQQMQLWSAASASPGAAEAPAAGPGG